VNTEFTAVCIKLYAKDTVSARERSAGSRHFAFKVTVNGMYRSCLRVNPHLVLDAAVGIAECHSVAEEVDGAVLYVDAGAAA